MTPAIGACRGSLDCGGFIVQGLGFRVMVRFRLQSLELGLCRDYIEVSLLGAGLGIVWNGTEIGARFGRA